MKVSRGLQLSPLIIAVLCAWPFAAAAQGEPQRQCDAAAVVYCGVYTPDELIFKLDHGDGRNAAKDLQQVLLKEKRGITADTIRTSVDGELTRDGQIIVGGRRMASGAQIAARDKADGASKDGGLYLRPADTQVKEGTTLPVLVSLKDGAYQWAVLKHSGDVVKAKADAASVTTPAAQQPAAGGSGEPLPQSGPAEVASGAAGLTGLGMAVVYFVRSKRDLHRALRRH